MEHPDFLSISTVSQLEHRAPSFFGIFVDKQRDVEMGAS